MYSISKTTLLRLVVFVMLATSIIACEQESITLLPEHISLEELSQQLEKELEEKLNKERSLDLSNSDNRLEIQQHQQGLTLTGDPVLIAKAVSIARQLDQPYNYYLEVRNTPANSINTATENMRILLHPGHPIILGHVTLINGPWEELIRDKQKFLQLELDSQLVLTIDIKSQQDKQMEFYSGKHPMQLGRWIVAFDQLEMNQGKKIITSRPKKQLWLRLIKANSQSEINLR
jgi:hypothetical protein